MNQVIAVDALTKSYGATRAVDGISFDVAPGEIFGMVGPNGAGKTTTIECVEGLRRADSGTIRVLDLDPQADIHELHERIGIQLQESALPQRLKVWEALDLFASFYRKSVDWRPLLARLDLEEKRSTQVAKLSGGQRQRLFIALALVNDPELVFLDELTTGLDPHARRSMWDLVRGIRDRGKSVCLTPILLIVFGAIFGNQPLTQWGLELGYIDIQVPALAAIIIGSVALIGIPIATAAERELGVLRRYRATPMRPQTFIVAQVVVHLTVCLLGMGLLIGLGLVFYGLRFQGSAPAVLAALVLSALAFFACGYLIASLSPSARVAQTVGMALFFPLMFLSGAAMPRQIMPERVRAFADWLPLTHVVEFLQGLWQGESFAAHGPQLAWLTGMLVVGTLVSVRFFRWE